MMSDAVCSKGVVRKEMTTFVSCAVSIFITKARYMRLQKTLERSDLLYLVFRYIVSTGMGVLTVALTIAGGIGFVNAVSLEIRLKIGPIPDILVLRMRVVP